MRAFRTLIWVPLGTLLLGNVLSAEVPPNPIGFTAEGIHTVQFHSGGIENSFPILRLGAGEQLRLDFDDLRGGTKNLQYTLLHCNADWSPSSLLKSEYLGGVFQEYINDFQFSTRTYRRYTHYGLSFPSENMTIKLPGNYILLVYTDSESDPVLSRKFYVYTQQVGIQAHVDRATYARYRDTRQEVDFTAILNDLNVPDPYRDLKVVLAQNWRFDNQIYGLKPQYIQDRKLIYDFEEGNLFEAGNEFRPLDIRDLRFKSQAVKFYTFDTFYHAELFTDDDRSYKAYQLLIDQNGSYVVAVAGAQTPKIEADYLWVDFSVRAPYPDDDEKMFVYGAFTNYDLTPQYEMKYSKRESAYKARILVKQGFYDYQFVGMKNGVPNLSAIEGSHWQTENTYHVLMYYRPLNMNGDLLVGYQSINTLSR